MHETNEKDSGQTVINYGNVWKFLFYVVLVWSEAVWLMLTGMKTRWVRVMIRALQGERPGRKKEKTKQNTPQSYSVSSFRPLLWITSRDLSSYVLLKVNEKNCARTRVKFTLKAAFLGKRKKWQREGGKKRRNPIESARELPEPQLTFLSGSEYKYHADIWAMICVCFLFFFMVLSWNSKGFVPEHAAHCTSVDQ